MIWKDIFLEIITYGYDYVSSYHDVVYVIMSYDYETISFEVKGVYILDLYASYGM